jgi:uncharacterized protein YbaR (Trm112 family)
MFIAKDRVHHRVILGTDIKENPQYQSRGELCCPICNKRLTYNRSARHPFDYFDHRDGTPDCTATDSATDGHRLPVEISIKQIHNRIEEVSGEEVSLDVERRIGSARNFKITDIRVTHPLKIAAEIYFGATDLELTRRLRTMFSNGYDAYVVFHLNGRHDVVEVERDLQRLAPLRIGRFNPETMELTLGDLFSRRRITFDKRARDALPNYLL